MADDYDDEREPLSFWGTVGAVMVSGIITTAVSSLAVFLVTRSAVKKGVLDAQAQPQFPGGNGG